MPADENKGIGRRFIQAWSAGGQAIVDELAASNIIVDYPALPQPLRGPAAFKQFLGMFHAAFPDVRISAEDLIAEGDKVVVRWSYRGTHQGELMGIPPTGKQVTSTGITAYRLADGKVVEERGVSDFLGLLQQLGVIPAPERAGQGGQ